MTIVMWSDDDVDFWRGTLPHLLLLLVLYMSWLCTMILVILRFIEGLSWRTSVENMYATPYTLLHLF